MINFTPNGGGYLTMSTNLEISDEVVNNIFAATKELTDKPINHENAQKIAYICEWMMSKRTSR